MSNRIWQSAAPDQGWVAADRKIHTSSLVRKPIRQLITFAAPNRKSDDLVAAERKAKMPIYCLGALWISPSTHIPNTPYGILHGLATVHTLDIELHEKPLRHDI